MSEDCVEMPSSSRFIKFEDFDVEYWKDRVDRICGTEFYTSYMINQTDHLGGGYIITPMIFNPDEERKEVTIICYHCTKKKKHPHYDKRKRQ